MFVVIGEKNEGREEVVTVFTESSVWLFSSRVAVRGVSLSVAADRDGLTSLLNMRLGCGSSFSESTRALL